MSHRTVECMKDMFDMSFKQEKMVDMLPALLLFVCRRPDKKHAAFNRILAMMEQMKISINENQMAEMIPAVIRAVDREPGYANDIFQLTRELMAAMGSSIPYNVLLCKTGLVLKLFIRHPAVISALLFQAISVVRERRSRGNGFEQEVDCRITPEY